jgi:hypothetical protein
MTPVLQVESEDESADDETDEQEVAAVSVRVPTCAKCVLVKMVGIGCVRRS